MAKPLPVVAHTPPSVPRTAAIDGSRATRDLRAGRSVREDFLALAAASFAATAVCCWPRGA
ncbi:MAG TPA: hypothetical protein VKP11_07115 [Frankiaceae bacterium]|nr:hypothetical protein [Frankiaceae bacterium]